MPDSYFDHEQALDFDDYANQLLEQGLQESPAHLHGGICGLLVAAPLEPDHCLAALCQALQLDIRGELAGSSLQLILATTKAMADDQFEFHLFLPDDETEIEQRINALADWCRGFLAGYAMAVTDPGADGLGDEVAEILKDVSAIAEVGMDNEIDDEEAESSYFELTEFLRFATLNLAQDALQMDEAE
ncbi:hypothetical protein EYC98_04250 [Halieaceae bacterium IMCC14734]|uniref:Uncharacterized protein n=1 Tax=Candidatus Litorirhabdus singularis TaxID=2518993 RepID=A0ABT3TDK3_9GAMM|nr:UPF0149 family protein [Candidatus Litorirhabdus singularis]MCX2980074.1 hypothetical protein [Candidatus Litorirhabdus singularis]